MNGKSAYIVMTRTGKKGYVYRSEMSSMDFDRLQVHIIDDKFRETGEKLLCSDKNLTVIGYRD